MGLEWNEGQVKIYNLLKEGISATQVIAQTSYKKSAVFKIQQAISQGDTPSDPSSEPNKGGKAKRDGHKGGAIPSTLVGSTTEVSETSLLKLTPHAQQVILTPDMYFSYMMALKKGYEGNIGDWLSLTARDFWLGREINFYQEVAGVGK